MRDDSDLERKFNVAASQPLNRKQRRALLQEAKRRKFNTAGRKALVKLPLDLGVRTFKRMGPKHLQREYKDYAYEHHRKATEPVLNQDEVQDAPGGGEGPQPQEPSNK